MKNVRGLFGYVVLAVCVLLSYQGYQNTLNPEATEHIAQGMACDVDPGCVIDGERPAEITTDVFGRHYQWRTSIGRVDTRCRRSMIFFGAWSCTAKKSDAVQ